MGAVRVCSLAWCACCASGVSRAGGTEMLDGRWAICDDGTAEGAGTAASE
jgi:hypothetical protein